MKGHPIAYSSGELAWIEAHRHLPRRELHAGFCARWGRADVSQANLTSLCKRKGWLTGRIGRYRKGRTPENKGKKMPFNANSARTRFRKGQRPHTFRGAGHERIDEKDGYVVMIVAERNPWTGAATRPVLKHRYLWEQANGPLPAGHCLKCLDGDRTNTDPTNWIAIPRALLPRLTGRWRGIPFDEAPDELKPILLQIARLEHAARQARKGARHTDRTETRQKGHGQ